MTASKKPRNKMGNMALGNVSSRARVRKTLQQRVMRQKKTLLAIAGIAQSGFGDVSLAHDTYLYEKP
jgi:hypothetical protein